ncbi:glycosyltransferase family 4 protein [Herbaspirillum chlorophenolicum]|uniref:Glycosyltransferase family 4 protein n=1 Tax=Herbaspirillum chlorophenolicum TaxID=211589 RepID=A0ABW8ES82_9BURK
MAQTHVAGGRDGLVIGVDASRNRSGGARAHLVGILEGLEPQRHGIAQVHVWAYAELLEALPERHWLVKHHAPALERSLPHQLLWQAFSLARELKEQACDILFTTDASTLCRFKPMVTLSQDLLSYEPGVMKMFGMGYQRLRLWAILYLQNRAFRLSDGVIFLTRYTGELIQRSCGHLSNVAYIPHGVDERFRHVAPAAWPSSGERSIRCMYVSPILEYKHQESVVEAFGRLRDKGLDVQLHLVGGGEGEALQSLLAKMDAVDPERRFVHYAGPVPYDQLPAQLAQADLFVFASSCETFGITLLEAMSAGLPIACSSRSSLPETLADAGVYFDPEDPFSIADAIERIIDDNSLRAHISARAKHLAEQYSWRRCAAETFGFIAQAPI